MENTDLPGIEVLSARDSPEPQDMKLVDVERMAEILGVNKNWIYRRTMAGAGGIPHYRVGRHVRFLVSEVLGFLRSDPGAGKEYPDRVSYGK